MLTVLFVIAIAYFGPPVLLLASLCGDTRLGLWYKRNPWPKAFVLALIPGFVRMALAILLILGAKSLWIHYYLTIFQLLPESIAVSYIVFLPESIAVSYIVPPGALSNEAGLILLSALAFLFGFISSLALLSIRNAFLKRGTKMNWGKTAYFAGMFLRLAAGSLVVVVAGVLVAALFFCLALGVTPANATDWVLLLFYVGAGPFLLWGGFCLMMGLFLIAEGFLRCE